MMGAWRINQAFADQSWDEELRQNGYLVRDLLSDQDISALTSLHAAVSPHTSGEMYTTTDSSDISYRQSVFNGIKDVILPRLPDILPSYKPCMMAFAAKTANTDKGSMVLHQDWSFVDHAEFTAVHIWCPLIDTDRSNGTLRVIPKSHRLLETFGISSTTQPVFATIWTELTERFAVDVPVNAGQAIFFDARILHGSGENHSDQQRVATVSAMIPEQSAFRFYHAEDPTTGYVDIYEVTPDFLQHYQLGTAPDGAKHVGRMAYPYRLLGQEDLAAFQTVL